MMTQHTNNILDGGLGVPGSDLWKKTLLTLAIAGVLGGKMQAQESDKTNHKRLDLTTVTDGKFYTSATDSTSYAQILDPKFDKMDYIYDENYPAMVRGVERELATAYFLEDMMGAVDGVAQDDQTTHQSRATKTLNIYKQLSKKLIGSSKGIPQLRSVALTRDNVNHFLASYKSTDSNPQRAKAETLQNIKDNLDVIMLYLGWFVYETSYMSKQTAGDDAYIAKTTTDPLDFLSTRSVDQYLDGVQGFQDGATADDMIDGLKSFLEAGNSREVLAYFLGRLMTEVKVTAEGDDTDAYIAALQRLEKYVHRSVDFDIIMGVDARQGLKEILLGSLPSISGSDKVYVRNLIRDLNNRNKTQAFADEIHTKDRNQAIIETAVQKEELKKEKTYDYFDHMDKLQYVGDANPIHATLLKHLKDYDRDTLDLGSLHTIDMQDPSEFFDVIADNDDIQTVIIDMGTIQERIEQHYADTQTAGSKVFVRLMHKVGTLSQKKHLILRADYNGFGRSFVEKADLSGTLHKERHAPYMQTFVASANDDARRDRRITYETDGTVQGEFEALASLESSINLPHLQKWPLNLDKTRVRCEAFAKSHRRGGSLGLGIYDISNDVLLQMAKHFDKRVTVYMPNITNPSPELSDIATISQQNNGPTFVFGASCGDYTQPEK